MEHIAKILIYN